ncbi:HNH endonuclease [Enterobacter ludwigii]
MNEVIKPSFRPGTVFDSCVEAKQSENLKIKLRSIRNEITTENRVFKNKGNTSLFFHMIRGDGIPPDVTKEEMEDLYESSFSQSKVVRKKYYDKIKLNAKDDICPYCAQRNVSTLDHYLPKSLYPKLVVNPLNLIPCCMECNHIKREHYPKNNEEQVLNPYFDGLAEDVWLIATIKKQGRKPPVLLFKAEPGNRIFAPFAERIIWHFNKFKLAELYTSQSGRQLTGIAESLKREWEQGGENNLRIALEEHYITWSTINVNSWQSAMFAALIESQWFISSGFKLCGEPRDLVAMNQ